MTTLLTNEEHLQVDRLYWDGLAMAKLYEITVCLRGKIDSKTAWRDRTHPRMTEAVAALDATDPKDVRKVKDAQTEVDNCTKLLARLEVEIEELTTKYNKAMAEHRVIYDRVLVHPFNGKIDKAMKARYPHDRPCC